MQSLRLVVETEFSGGARAVWVDPHLVLAPLPRSWPPLGDTAKVGTDDGILGIQDVLVPTYFVSCECWLCLPSSIRVLLILAVCSPSLEGMRRHGQGSVREPSTKQLHPPKPVFYSSLLLPVVLFATQRRGASRARRSL